MKAKARWVANPKYRGAGELSHRLLTAVCLFRQPERPTAVFFIRNFLMTELLATLALRLLYKVDA